LKFIRFLLTALATVAALAVLLVAAAFTPPLQTWFARMELLDQPGVQGSLGSLSASFGKLEVEDLKLQIDGNVLTLPSMQARLPLIRAIWHRQVLVEAIVAKDWTLDLSRLHEREADPTAPDTGAEADSASAPVVKPETKAVLAFGGILTGRKLPFDASLDGVDLEGDVLVVAVPGKAPVRVHVTVTGGGVAAGHQGVFVIDAARATEDANAPGDSATAHCHLVVSMDSPRTVDRIEIKADLSGTLGSQRVDLGLAAAAAKPAASGEEAYSVDLSRGDRHVATVLARFPPSSQRLSGTWKVDLRDADFAPFALGRPLPSLAASGDGQFDADVGFERVHALGRVAWVASRMEVVSPILSRLGTVSVDSQFDLTSSGQSLHIETLTASFAGERPAATVKALQPFDFDPRTGGIKVGNPQLDWLDVAIQGFPLTRLPMMPGGLSFGAGDAAGEFTLHSADGAYTMRAKAPFTAKNVSLLRSAAAVARNLDLAMAVSADFRAKQWQFQWSPITVDSDGHRLATIDAKGSLPLGANAAIAVSGSWKADLDALASLRSVPALNWVTGRSASGDFTGSVGAASELECKMVVVGHDASHTVNATVNADEDASGAGELLAPVKVAFGADVSDISVEATWAADKSEPRAEIKLTSDSVSLDHLRLLAAPLAAAGGVALPSRSSAGGASWSSAGVRDQAPFWGDWVGRLAVTFEKLRTGDQDLTDVGGSFEVDHGSVELEGGHAELPSKSMANIAGSVVFDAAGEHPYVLKGTASGLSNVDSALLLPPQPGDDPVIQGHFTVAGSISGTGINLDDLMGGTQEEFQLAGTNGILRLLRTNIADVIPEAKEPVSDSLGDAGNFVSSILGIKGHSIDPAKNKVGKIPEAVINITDQVGEIGYDTITVTAIRGSDRSIRLTNLEMTAPDEHLKGSGLITYVRGLPISAEPLSVELQLGVHDVLTKLLATAGLLSSGKDAIGYSLLREPIRFGGTLAHIDASQWHDLLAKAAVQNPSAEKKGPSGTGR
jgi:hypothetical protein